jgi:hypothetical protein
VDLDSEWRRADVGFALDALAHFGERVTLATWTALEACGGDRSQVDVPNLAAAMVPVDDDEVHALAHVLTGKPVEDLRASRIVLHDYAAASILRAME